MTLRVIVWTTMTRARARESADADRGDCEHAQRIERGSVQPDGTTRLVVETDMRDVQGSEGLSEPAA